MITIKLSPFWHNLVNYYGENNMWETCGLSEWLANEFNAILIRDSNGVYGNELSFNTPEDATMFVLRWK